MNIDWDTNITLAIGYTMGFIVGAVLGVAWYWFPVVVVSGLVAMIAYDIAKASLLRGRIAP